MAPVRSLGNMRIASVVLVLWLLIGALAAGQRGYFGASPGNCATVATVAVTIVAGPLNYVGLNPRVECPELPEPSP